MRNVGYPTLTTQTSRAGRRSRRASASARAVSGDGIVPAVHVYSDDLPVVVGLDPPPDVSLVYLVAQAGGLFYREGWPIGLGAGMSASLMRPPFTACFYTPHSTIL